MAEYTSNELNALIQKYLAEYLTKDVEWNTKFSLGKTLKNPDDPSEGENPETFINSSGICGITYAIANMLADILSGKTGSGTPRPPTEHQDGVPTGVSSVVATGAKKVGRIGDEIKSTSSEDSAFWTWLSGFIAVFQSWVPVPNDGGTSLKVALTSFFASNPTPSSLTGKITKGSDKVSLGGASST